MDTCYRHPDRETGVSCSNCGRPICPDCMTSTPVGMRCPECARQRTKVKTGTSAFGRSMGISATYILIGVNVVAFLIEIAAGAGGLDAKGSVINDFGVFGPAIANQDEWYRIVTGGFLHAGPIHLLFNMFALYVLGNMLEPAIGTPRFVALYVSSLLAGSFGALLLTPDTVTVGASGAIFGIFAAAFVIARGRGLQQIASEIGFLLVINLVITFSIPGISIGGHLGGIVGGAIGALAIIAGDRGMIGSRRMATEIGVMVAVAAISATGAVAVA